LESNEAHPTFEPIVIAMTRGVEHDSGCFQSKACLANATGANQGQQTSVTGQQPDDLGQLMVSTNEVRGHSRKVCRRHVILPSIFYSIEGMFCYPRIPRLVERYQTGLGRNGDSHEECNREQGVRCHKRAFLRSF
jgi:hypothetical protein